MRETLPLGGHHIYDVLVGRRLRSFYDRIARQNPGAESILDVGCGPGHMAASLAHHHPDADVVGLDLDPVQVHIARRQHEAPNLRFDLGDVAELPLPDASVDWAVTTESFHHWGDPARGLAEVHRVLRPGGALWIVEGAGDMSRAELMAWTGRWAPPGLAWWVRQVFRRHGYTPEALREVLLPLAEASPFGGADVERVDGWWVVRAQRTAQAPSPATA